MQLQLTEGRASGGVVAVSDAEGSGRDGVEDLAAEVETGAFDVAGCDRHTVVYAQEAAGVVVRVHESLAAEAAAVLARSSGPQTQRKPSLHPGPPHPCA